MELRSYYVYLLTNTYNRVLYIGVTNNLYRRIYKHKEGLARGFTRQYNLHKLIYYEIYDIAEAGIKREKQLKNWHHDWKLNLAKQANPSLRDISDDFDF